MCKAKSKVQNIKSKFMYYLYCVMHTIFKLFLHNTRGYLSARRTKHQRANHPDQHLSMLKF